jgi:N-acetylglucosaminyldiphosphoundecaprenol N-acetyl-beta-D-mannosaminyltransferase
MVSGATVGIRKQIEQSTAPDPWPDWIEICGLRLARIGRQDAVCWLRQRLRSGRSHLIVTLDASGVVIAQDDAEYRQIVNSADLVTPDSTGILWAASRHGVPLLERVCGIDLIGDIAAVCAETGRSIYLLGSRPGVAGEAATALAASYPGLRLAGAHHGYFGAAEGAAIVEMVQSSKPDVVFIGMGIPRQEKWARRHLAELGASVVMGVGGSFEVIAGRRRRAPLWMRRHGLEWLWRLGSDPRKIRKNLMLFRFVAAVRASARRLHQQPDGGRV